MGLHGPVSKRNAERVDTSHKERRNEEVESVTTPAPYLPPLEPDGSPAWHPIAHELYLSFEQSGQSQFFQPSDWMQLYLLCESISRDLAPQYVAMVKTPEGERPVKMTLPLKGASMSAYRNQMAALMATEADRRRLSLELNKAIAEKPEQTPGEATVTDLRTRFGKKAT